MGDVSQFDGITKADMPPDRVLKEAVGNCTGGAVVIGYDAAGDYYFASSFGSAPETLWLLEAGKQQLMDLAEDDAGPSDG